MQQRKITKVKDPSKITKVNRIPLVKPFGVSCLTFIALGENSNTNNIAQLIASLIATYNCNIIDSKIIELGNDIAFSVLINGKWNNIVKIEKHLQILTKKYPVHIYSKRNNIITNQEINETIPYINYIVQATTINKPGLLNKLLQFFHKENITIKEANINTINNNTNLINIIIQLKIPATNHILSLREKFLTYCDALNLDTSLEPTN